jgi:GT2 family glycosyltransferase
LEKHSAATKVVRVNLEDGLRPLVVENRYREVLLVVTLAGSVEGHVVLSASAEISREAQETAILSALGDSLWRRGVALAFARAARLSQASARGNPSISIAVSARSGGDRLRACLASILALETTPLEIVVVDEARSGRDIAQICARAGVRRISAETIGGGRNAAILATTGEAVAFTSDGCVVDPRWLDGLGTAFADPLMMAIAGYVGPLELETEAQRASHRLAGEGPPFHTIPPGFSLAPLHHAWSGAQGANAIFRRRVFEEIGLFAHEPMPESAVFSAAEAYAFYRILAAGYRLVLDPARIVWRRHPSDARTHLRSIRASAAAASAYSSRCLLVHREFDSVRLTVSRARARVRRVRSEERPTAALIAGAAGVLEGLRRGVSSEWMPGPAPARCPRARTRERAVVGAAPPPLSVVIPSYNRLRQLETALTALTVQAYPRDRYEVVAVIDGSTDGSVELARSLETPYQLHVVEQPNRGVAAARNRGAEDARHPLVVFLDDDLVPDRDFLARHAIAHRDAAEEDVAFGYCPPVVEGRRWWEFWLRDSWEDYYRHVAEPDHQWTFMDFASANVSLRRSFFLSSGGFDEEFRRRNEERELGIRLLARGARLRFWPAMRAQHELDTRFSTELRHIREVAKSDVLLARKHPEVKSRLGGVAALRRPGPAPLSARALFAYLHPRASARLAVLGLPALDALEALRLRKQWHALMSALLTHSYVLGLEDALSDREQLVEFVGSIGPTEHDALVDVPLDETRPLRIAPGAVSPALEVAYRGSPLARVAALGPGEYWDWDAVTGRVVSQALRPLQQAVALDELLDLLRARRRDDGDGASTAGARAVPL